jgi:hypothetical protein
MRVALGRGLRVTAAVAGLALFVVAARYVADRSLDVRPALWVRWWVTAAVVHDVVVAPVAIVVGWLVVRFSPRIVKAPLQAGLIVSAIVVLTAWPALRGYGRIPSNPTYLPRDYGTGLAVSLALVWGGCAAWALIRLLRGRHPA